jgi:hypothetical protein
MTKFIRALCAIALLVLGQTAFASVYYDSGESCLSAIEDGSAVEYKPTGKAKGFGDARIAGLGLRGLEWDACADMATMAGRKWVFQKQGTLMYTSGAEIKFHGDCQNTIYTVMYRKPKQTPIADAIPAPVPAPTLVQHGSCSTSDCNTAVQEQVVNQVIRRSVVCKDDATGTTFAPTSGQCNFAPVQGNVTMTTTSSVSCGNCGRTPGSQAPATQPVVNDDCVGDCRREAHVVRSEPRSDGLCVYPMRDTQTGAEYTVLLGTMIRNGMNLLVATKMADNRRLGKSNVSKEELHTLLQGSQSGFVGDDRQSVKMERKDCKVAERYFLSNRSFELTAKRIGLPTSCVMGTRREYTRP